jgi:hypothetical protein
MHNPIFSLLVKSEKEMTRCTINLHIMVSTTYLVIQHAYIFISHGMLRHICTYLPRFFHRAKNDSPFISVGSKNLLIVRGSLMVNFWGTLLYINVKIMLGASGSKKEKKLITP